MSSKQTATREKSQENGFYVYSAPETPSPANKLFTWVTVAQHETRHPGRLFHHHRGPFVRRDTERPVPFVVEQSFISAVTLVIVAAVCKVKKNKQVAF